jgi:hypothetical protein
VRSYGTGILIGLFAGSFFYQNVRSYGTGLFVGNFFYQNVRSYDTGMLTVL